MNRCKIFILIASLAWMYACGEEFEPEKEGTGQVVISVASRGVYQFLILFDGNLYYPENLPIQYKVVSQEPILVNIRFQVLDYQQDIFEPAPNDVPVFLKKLPVIRLIDIEKI